jgi:hypothetical protein
MRVHPLNVSELRRAAQACAVFRINACEPEYLRDLLAVLLEEDVPHLAAKVRALSSAQARALQADLLAAPR